jgi:hypothetical protein
MLARTCRLAMRASFAATGYRAMLVDVLMLA